MALSWAVGITALLSIQALQGSAAATSFITLGDWGGAALENPGYGNNVAAVATQMQKTLKSSGAKFIVNTGDNIYWCGLENTSDYQFAADWLNPYGGKGLIDVPWYGVLGNHEYGYDVQSQIDLGKKYKSWVLDDRYYTRRVAVGGEAGANISFIFIDTSPCISEYRAADPYGWDPCGTMYPTCSIKSPADPHDQFEGKCRFNENILTQDCGTQYAWFEAQLKAVPAGDWVIVVGHHPSDEIDVNDFTTAMQHHGFDLFLNGHAHTLTHYSVDGNFAYVTSGAGAMVGVTAAGSGAANTSAAPGVGGAHPDSSVRVRVPDTPGKNRTYRKEEGLELAPYNDHQYKQIWNQKVSGFTMHTFSSDYSSLTTDFLDDAGNTLHSFSVTKGVAPPPAPAPGPKPPPSPGPPAPPGPAPAGGCCHYHDAKCSSGQVCCKSDCESAATCSYVRSSGRWGRGDRVGVGCSRYTEEGCSGKYGAVHHCAWSADRCVVA